MSSGYSQSNSYGGGGAGPLVGPDGTDQTTLPSTVPTAMMVYNHVARAISQDGVKLLPQPYLLETLIIHV